MKEREVATGVNRRQALQVMATSAVACSIPSLLTIPADALLERLGAAPGDAPARRSLTNLLRRGHCAPAVLETLLPPGAERGPLLRMAGGLPGGIGNSGAECGGVTGVALALGLALGGAGATDIVRVLAIGRGYVGAFRARHGSTDCRDILGRRGMTACLRAVTSCPRLLAGCLGEASSAPPRLLDHTARRALAGMREAGFHCAHAVLLELDGPVDAAVLRASCGLVGGTLLMGGTCSAVTAGVLAIGRRIGAIEGNPLRVVRMMARMMAGGDAMADDVNGFNRTIRLGGLLLRRTAAALGSVRCGDLAGTDLSTPHGCERYLAGRRVARCRDVAARVAEQVRAILAAEG